MTSKSIRRMTLCAVAVFIFPFGAWADDTKGGSHPAASERAGVATPIRVILPALWDQKTTMRPSESAPTGEPRR